VKIPSIRFTLVSIITEDVGHFMASKNRVDIEERIHLLILCITKLHGKKKKKSGKTIPVTGRGGP
jgi:hypothetical protein